MKIDSDIYANSKKLTGDERYKKLYHYTSFDSFVKIWLNQNLRFSPLSAVNDIQEVDFKTAVINSDRLDLCNRLNKHRLSYKQISFTMDYDSALKGCMSPMMWGLYADKRKGVCIELEYDKIKFPTGTLKDVVTYQKYVKWQNIVDILKSPEGEVCIAVVGKYMMLLEAYKSLNEALMHGGIANRYKVRIKWVDSEALETQDPAEVLNDVSAILVPGGFGKRGTHGMINAIKYARENKVPFLGICFGMQMAVIETMRNLCGIKNAGTTELDENCEPVIGLMTEWDKDGAKQIRHKDGDLGGTMRLGAYDCMLKPNSKISQIYNADRISERHRHRYEVNIKYKDMLNKAGMLISGTSPDGNLPEIVERSEHPWFIAVQFHPELKSKPFAPHPLFVSFVKAAIDNSRLV